MRTDYDLDTKILHYKINGFVVFEGFMPVAKVDRIREAFMPLLYAVAERRGRQTSWPNRYTADAPWIEPFADPEIYESPVILGFLDRIWRGGPYLITCYSSNNPFPGSTYQHWHRDNPLMTPYTPSPVPTGNIGVKFPLVDTSEENGSFELIPSTQYLADPDMESRYDEIIEAGGDFTKRRLNMKKGDLWIQDPRTLHRGTPNRSDYPRPELVICYSRPWISQRKIEITRSEYEKLSERSKNLLRESQIIDDSTT